MSRLRCALLLAIALPAAHAAPPRQARTLYNTKCALCHGRDGKTNPALDSAKVRNFTDPEWQKARTDDELRAAIENGREGTLMRAYKGELSPEEIAGLVKHVRAFAPPEPPPAEPPK